MKTKASSRLLLVPVMGCMLFAGCAKNESKNEQLSFAQYQEKVEESLSTGSKLDAMNNLSKMISDYPDNMHVETYRLQLADLYFDEGKAWFDNERLSAAAALYDRFVRFNPSDPKAEYASYRTILSFFYQTQSYECDTSAYEGTIKVANEHLENPKYAAGRYNKDVQDIIYTCKRRLIDKEVYVFNTYLRQDKIKSAENRLKGLREDFLPEHADLEPRIKFLECKLSLRKNETEQAEKLAAELEAKFPESEFVQMSLNAVGRVSGTKFVA